MVVNTCVDAGCKDCWGVGFYWCCSVCVLVVGKCNGGV